MQRRMEAMPEVETGPRGTATIEQQRDRHWAEMLQELRVVQTGVQLLAGFLVTIPFQARFGELSGTQHVLFLVALGLAIASVALLIAPVSLHRTLFRRRRREALIAWSARLAQAGLACLALTMVSAVALIASVVLDTTAAVVLVGVTTLVFALLWVVLPEIVARRAQPDR